MENIILTNENFKEVITHMVPSGDKPFLNSQCMFVEYHDIIKAPWFILLSVLNQNKKIEPILDLNKIKYFNTDALFEWYCNRDNRNFLFDLAKAPLDKVDYDLILDILMKGNEVFYQADTSLNVVPVIKTALQGKHVKELVVYSEKYCEFIEKDIVELFGKRPNMKYLYGNLKNVLSSIPQDSTYFFSDFNKVIDLQDAGKLDYSSVILPYDYAYNYIKDENGEKKPIVDLVYIGRNTVFKYNFFNACYQ